MNELLEGLGYPLINVPLTSCESRDSALAFLVQVLVQTGKLPPPEASKVIDGLVAREKSGATVLGKGLSLPHLAVEAIDQVVGVVGLAAKAIPWPGAFDGKSIGYICLLLTPASKPLETLLAEESVIRHLFQSGRAKEQAIRLRAYRYWDAAGRPDDTSQHFWLLAEQDLTAGR